jgi:glycosyltransferase involved in cell wall biosynthesis
MKIAFVIPGGVDRSGRDRVVPMFLWLIERLARRHELHVFVVDYYPDPQDYRLLGATVHDLGRPPAIRGVRRLIMQRRLETALRAHGPFDLLHAYWGMPAGAATTSIAARVGAPAIVTFDSGELVRLDDIAYGLQRRWIDRHAIRRTIRRAAAITVPTQFMARIAAEAGAQPSIVPVGVDATRFPPPGDRPDGPPWKLIRVGSLNRVKDYATLMDAMTLLADRRDIHLDVVGEDTLGGAIQRMAEQIGVAESVTFHGVQPTDVVARLMAAAHLNVVSSRHESANVTVLEAACAGVPTVGTAVGYVADWHPDRAIAVPPRNPAALATAIRDLLRDADRRRRLAGAARAWALAHDADWTAAAFERVYEAALTQRSRLVR